MAVINIIDQLLRSGNDFQGDGFLSGAMRSDPNS
jgi:hypothetical protein